MGTWSIILLGSVLAAVVTAVLFKRWKVRSRKDKTRGISDSTRTPKSSARQESRVDKMKTISPSEERAVASELPRPKEHAGGARELGSDIFIVHGRDEDAKEAVARFLQKLGLNGIVLREQANRGRAVIEKFEDYANVGFAVVLMTPDDVGALAQETDSLKHRARQNVVFEFGFFVAKLGRQRIFALLKGDIEVPSDYQGVLYLAMDEAGKWKVSLARELIAAGLKISSEKLTSAL